VVYPHMNSIGGDSFWLIHAPGAPPVGVDASGRAGSKAHVDLYRATGLSEIPTRGPLAANTVAGAVSGWARALELSADWRTPTPLEALLEPAIAFAEAGSITPEGMAEVLADKAKELGAVDGFAQPFLAGGVPAS